MRVLRGNAAPRLSLALLLALAGCQSAPPEPTVTVLGEGGDVRMANGAAFDAEDRLYIASLFGREILVFNSRTGEWLRSIGHDQGVDGPDDLVVGPDGTIYWTDAFGGEVGRLTPDGTVAKQQVAPGVNPIAMSDDGRLFVGLDFLGDALYELDPQLIEPPRLIASDFGSINGMDFGPDGFLYGPSRSEGSAVRDRIIRVNVDSGEIEVAVADLGGSSSSVRFDSTGRLHALINDQLQRIDLATGEREVLAEFLGADNFAFNSMDRPYVTQNDDGAVIELFDLAQMRVIAGGGLILPGGLALTTEPIGEVLHVGTWSGMRRYGAETGDATGVESERASTVAAQGDHLILSHNFFGTVTTWDLSTRQPIATLTGFTTPVNAIGFGDAIVVAELGPDPGTGRVLLLEGEGDDRRVIADSSQGVGAPAGLVSRDGSLWVADWDDGTLWLLAEGGEPLSVPRLVASDLDQPEGMAFAADGRLLIAETGAERLTAIDLDSGDRTILVSDLGIGEEAITGFPRTHLFTGVAVGASGTIYIAGDRANVIYTIDLGGA